MQAVFYANCNKHQHCGYRFRCEIGCDVITVYGAGIHSEEPALVREYTRIPLTRIQHRAIEAEVRKVGPEKAAPLDVQDQLLGTEAELPPGLAVRNLTKRMRRQFRRFRKYGHRPSVDGLAAFLQRSPLPGRQCRCTSA